MKQPTITILLVAIMGGLAGCSTPSTSPNGRVEPARQTTPVPEDTLTQEEPRVREEVLEQAPVTLPSPAADAADLAMPSLAAGAAPEARRKQERLYPEKALVAPGIAPNGVFDRYALPNENRENYAHLTENGVQRAAEHPLSTFSIDVDTGSYSNVRRLLTAGSLPPRDAVRVEELINYFDYDYPRPEDTRVPFRVHSEIAATPWNSNTYLLHIGIKGYEVSAAQLPAANLVFLVDVSGSMDDPNKLGLLRTSLQMLAGKLRARDRVSLVVYAGASGVVLEPTAGDQRLKIERALARLSAGGSTNGAAGIELAYQMAQQAYIAGGINRVLLATDGDFNVGVTDFQALKNLVEEKRKTGISLTTLGFGSGNYNDQLMEQLADAGNGNYAYIDTLNEAQKVLVDQMSATLQTIASDVKIQVEFNPALVAEYRLLGYENRVLRREDFTNDQVDAGEIGAGHSVTALYEIALVGGAGQRIDELRYGTAVAPVAAGDELAFIKLRYKAPGTTHSVPLSQAVRASDIVRQAGATSDDFRFAASVAAFGQLLRGGTYTGGFGYDDVLQLARTARGPDPYVYRGDFIRLVNLARSLSGAGGVATLRE